MSNGRFSHTQSPKSQLPAFKGKGFAYNEGQSQKTFSKDSRPSHHKGQRAEIQDSITKKKNISRASCCIEMNNDEVSIATKTDDLYELDFKDTGSLGHFQKIDDSDFGD